MFDGLNSAFGTTINSTQRQEMGLVEQDEAGGRMITKEPRVTCWTWLKKRKKYQQKWRI
jgi:hypothetical protein